MSSSFYLYDPPAVSVITSNPINVSNSNSIIVTNSNPIQIITANNSNLATYNLSVYNVANVNSNLNVLGNIIVAQTLFCTSLNTQNYYVQNVISTSNIYAYDLNINDVLTHPRQIGSNTTSVTIIDNQGYIDCSNIKNWPIPKGQTIGSYLSSISGFAQAGASLLNSGVSIASGLENLFGNGLSDAANLGTGLTDSLESGLQDGSADNNSSYSPSNSIMVSWNNLTKKNLYSDQNNTAIQANLVLSDTSSIVYDRTLSFNINTNNNLTYTKTGQTKILDVPGSILYVANFSNVNSIMLSNIQITANAIRRVVGYSNNIGVDGVQFSNFTVSNAQFINASNLQCQTLTTSNIISSSNNVLNIYSSNQTNIYSCNQTNINATPLVINGQITFGSNGNIYNASNITSQSLSNTSFYTGSSNLYVSGDVNTSSLWVNSNQLLVNKKIISSQDFSNSAFYTSNGKLYTNELVVNGIVHVNVIDMLPTVPVTSNMNPGIYAGSRLSLDATNNSIIFYDSLNGNMLQNGTVSANRPVADNRWQANYNANVFSF